MWSEQLAARLFCDEKYDHCIENNIGGAVNDKTGNYVCKLINDQQLQMTGFNTQVN